MYLICFFNDFFLFFSFCFFVSHLLYPSYFSFFLLFCAKVRNITIANLPVVATSLNVIVTFGFIYLIDLQLNTKDILLQDYNGDCIYLHLALTM